VTKKDARAYCRQRRVSEKKTPRNGFSGKDEFATPMGVSKGKKKSQVSQPHPVTREGGEGKDFCLRPTTPNTVWRQVKRRVKETRLLSGVLLKASGTPWTLERRDSKKACGGANSDWQGIETVLKGETR